MVPQILFIVSIDKLIELDNNSQVKSDNLYSYRYNMVNLNSLRNNEKLT